MDVVHLKIQAVPYFRACCLLKSCASLLRMPPRAVATALAYLHRWQRAGDASDSPQDAMLSACLLLASKAEEASVSNNHLLNVVKLVGQMEQERLQGGLVTAPPQPGCSADDVVGLRHQHHPHQPERAERNGSGGDQAAAAAGRNAAASAGPDAGSEEGEVEADMDAVPGPRPEADGPAGPWGAGRAGAAPGKGRSSSRGDEDSLGDSRDGSRRAGEERHDTGKPTEMAASAAAVSAAAAAAAAAKALLLVPEAAAVSAAALQACLVQCPVLVGTEYYAAKQGMLDAEQRLLRALQFRVAVRQPHALLLNAARCLRMPPGVQRLALALLNDLWSYTDLCCLAEADEPASGGAGARADAGGAGGGAGGAGGAADVVAMAVLEAAARLAGWEVRVPTHARDEGLSWWQLLGAAVDEAGMAGMVEEVMRACAACHDASVAAAVAAAEATAAAAAAGDRTAVDAQQEGL